MGIGAAISKAPRIRAPQIKADGNVEKEYDNVSLSGNSSALEGSREHMDGRGNTEDLQHTRL